MKKIIFLLPVLFCLKATTQQPYYDFKTFKEHSPIYKAPDNRAPLDAESLQKFKDLLEEKTRANAPGRLEFTFPNGDNVYAMPVGNMPNLVPDLSRTNYNMPILKHGEKVTGMPPGSVPQYHVIPKK